MNRPRTLCLLVCVSILAFAVLSQAGPGRGNRKPPPTDRNGLIMEYTSCSHFGGCHGQRLLKDGRYETLRDGGWVLYRQLCADEMRRFRRGLRKVDLSGLQEEYRPEVKVMDGASTRYVMPAGEGFKNVVVRAGAEVPEIKNAWSALEEALQWPFYNTIWYVTGEEGVATHRFDCAPDRYQPLFEVTMALARAEGRMVEQGGPAEGTPVYTVVWLSDGRMESWQEFWKEGWKVYGGPGMKTEVYRLTAGETQSVVTAFGNVNWESAAPLSGRDNWWRWVVPGQIISAVAPERAWGGTLQWEKELRSAACSRRLAVLNLRERTDAFIDLQDAAVKHIPVKDFSPPTIEQVEEAIAFIDSNIAAGNIVVVHCLGGCGRTGTVLSAWLKKTEELTADDAITRLRTINPCFVETPDQESFVSDY